MKRYRPRYTPEVAARIRTLHPEIKQEIREAVRTLLSSPHSGHDLQYELSGYRSYRVRSYRILYQINEESGTLDVVYLGPRRTVYEQFRALLDDQTKGN